MQLACVICPDCSTVLVLKFSLIATNGKLVHVTTCHACRDGRSVRAWESLTDDEVKAFYMAGVPVVEYASE